ncbi:hypothetical protein MMB69_24775 [Priestia sp. P5]|nr:hypothetical protein [Priestia sp. P5]MDG0061916.1 hypothetical protein [Priestia sp. P5]
MLMLVSENFILFTGKDNSLWRTAVRNVSSHLGVPINVYGIGSQGDCVECEDSWESVYDVTSQGAVLIRPDGFVAWRTKEGVSDPHLLLKQVMTSILW